MKISVVGLGKLGACFAASMAARGYKVLGVDINQYFISRINSHKAPFFEPDLQKYIDKAGENLTATSDYNRAITETDATFLIVPTPSLPSGHFSNQYLIEALIPLAQALKKHRKRYHLFTVVSTVSPGSSQDKLIPLIEKHSGRKLNKGFGFSYNPTLIALGSVINDFLKPDVVILGESDKKTGDILEKIHKKICLIKANIVRMSVESAEITKISLNAFITMKISFANTLSNICERVPGAKVDDITRALGFDKRVSPYYLKAGLAYGGPCFPRDNRAFAAFIRTLGIDAKLAKATDEVNNFQIDELVSKVKDLSKKHDIKKIAVLGMSYKPNTPVIEESPGVGIVKALLKSGISQILVHDLHAREHVLKEFGEKVVFADSLKQCFQSASLIIITTMGKEYSVITSKDIVRQPTYILDCWRILNSKDLGKDTRYIPIGIYDKKESD